MELKDQKITVVENVENLSKGQKEVHALLKGRKFTIKKIVQGKRLLCNCCGKKSRVVHSNFAVVSNEAGQEKKIAAGCLSTYFGIELVSKRKAGSRITL